MGLLNRLFGTPYEEKIHEIDSYLAQGGAIPLERKGGHPRSIVRGSGNAYTDNMGFPIGLGDDEVDKVRSYAKRNPIPGKPKA